MSLESYLKQRTEPCSLGQYKTKLISDNVNSKIYKASYGSGSKAIVIKEIFLEKCLFAITELEIQQLLSDKPGIIQYYDSWRTATHLYIVVQHAHFGDLYNFLKDEENFPILLAIQIFQQMVIAVNSCHGAGIIHRDIKLENFVVDLDGIKLIDFGCSIKKPNIYQTRAVGTSDYFSPEVRAGKHQSYANDIWALGVCLYEMTCGLAEDYKFYTLNCNDIRVRDLLNQILVAEEQRPTIKDLMEHSIMQIKTDNLPVAVQLCTFRNS